MIEFPQFTQHFKKLCAQITMTATQKESIKYNQKISDSLRLRGKILEGNISKYSKYLFLCSKTEAFKIFFLCYQTI
jgi:hypothetical protein